MYTEMATGGFSEYQLKIDRRKHLISSFGLPHALSGAGENVCGSEFCDE